MAFDKMNVHRKPPKANRHGYVDGFKKNPDERSDAFPEEMYTESLVGGPHSDQWAGSKPRPYTTPDAEGPTSPLESEDED
jgi:hypothetical protein